MSNMIHHKFFYPHPSEMVWEYLTKAELVSQWLMQNDLQPILGHEFQFRTKPMPNFDLDGIFYCTVLEIVPFKKLSYSWKGGPGTGRMILDTIVVWTLVEKNDGTELELVHSGFKETEGFTLYDAMNQGWLTNMRKIEELINAVKHDPNNT